MGLTGSAPREGYIYGGGVSQPYAAVRGGFIQGGDSECAGYLGGREGSKSIKEIAGYSESAARMAKDEIVRAVVRTVAGMFHTPLPSDTDAALKAMQEMLPNPRGDGRSFAASAEAQKTICDDLAKGFNAHLTPGRKGHKALIDRDGDPAYVCRAVAELVDGLASGMRTEFLDIQVELRRLIRNMEILIQLADDESNAVEAAVEASGDSTLRRDAEIGIGRGAKAIAALRHQLTVLKSLLNTTVADAEKEMELALREKDESISDVLKGMGMEPGSQLLSDNIAGTLVGLATVATMAKDLNKALGRVGMGVGAFFDAASFADVEKAADAAGAAAPDEVGKILSAKETLRKSFGMRGRRGLRKRMGGDDNVDFGDGVAELDGLDDPAGQFATGGDGLDDPDGYDDPAGQFVGGYDDDPAVSKLEKRMEREQKERILIVREFTKKLHRSYGKILAAVKATAPQIGKSVPAGATFREFVQALKGLGGGSTKYMELALVGFYPDSTRAESLRTSYLSSLERLISAAAALGPIPGIEQIRTAAAEIQKTVDFYGNVMAKRAAASDGSATGGALKDKDLDKMFPILNSTTHSIDEAVRLMRYHGFVASVQTNMKQAAEEIESYGEEYTELLGDAVAERLETDGLKYETLRKYLETYKPGHTESDRVLTAGAPGALTFQGYMVTKGLDFTRPLADGVTKKVFQELKDVATQRIDQTQKAKGEMYRAAQAVDLALQTFTREALQAPETLIRDVRRSLEDTKVIARWYSDDTGDSIVEAFEGLRNRTDLNGMDRAVAGTEDGMHPDGVAVGPDGDHYYQRVVTAEANDQVNGNPGPVGSRATHVAIGNHFDIQLATEGDLRRAQGAVERSLKNMQALKNLVNVFVRMGSPAKMFMKASQLYSILVNYLKVSSFRVPSVVESTGGAWSTTEAGDVDDAGRGMIRRMMHFTFAPAFRGTVPDDNLSCMGFDNTNTLFFTTVKAMCAKVMSILNLYDMMEKPSKLGGLTPIRTILGGGSAVGGAAPEVIPDATGMYFHLPRLAEFYIDLFLRRHNMENAAGQPLADSPFGPGKSPPWAGGNNTARLIMLVPDAAGTFAGLIKLYFSKFARDRAGPLTGTYGVGEATDVIGEINKIYRHYSSRGTSEAVTKAACLGFVAEINRRYGVVTKAQWGKMEELWQSAYEGDELAKLDLPSSSTTNYAILPGEDDDLPDAIATGAPSDGFLLDPRGRGRTLEGRPLKARKHRFHLGDGDWDMIRDLREAMIGYFAGDDGFAGENVFADVIAMKAT